MMDLEHTGCMLPHSGPTSDSSVFSEELHDTLCGGNQQLPDTLNTQFLDEKLDERGFEDWFEDEDFEDIPGAAASYNDSVGSGWGLGVAQLAIKSCDDVSLPRRTATSHEGHQYMDISLPVGNRQISESGVRLDHFPQGSARCPSEAWKRAGPAETRAGASTSFTSTSTAGTTSPGAGAGPSLVSPFSISKQLEQSIRRCNSTPSSGTPVKPKRVEEAKSRLLAKLALRNVHSLPEEVTAVVASGEIPEELLPELLDKASRKGKGGRQPAQDPRSDPSIDPKKAKRILANRQSAARSKLKQKLLVEALRTRQDLLVNQRSSTEEELEQLRRTCRELQLRNRELENRLRLLEHSKRSSSTAALPSQHEPPSTSAPASQLVIPPVPALFRASPASGLPSQPSVSKPAGPVPVERSGSGAGPFGYYSLDIRGLPNVDEPTPGVAPRPGLVVTDGVPGAGGSQAWMMGYNSLGLNVMMPSVSLLTSPSGVSNSLVMQLNGAGAHGSHLSFTGSNPNRVQ
mmetsp:Transcript_17277/g.37276  ORF Transcript_17277/g.37276 Transcript_17277/m.37276 type:complete len:515 (-) Transcript_17277:1247-2791(-)|eukprot:CAMPEP_0202906972 /NCGR_PEP_ID=MMETSP1392-20130828/40883_1 /ASSEMBLY_ACC=CAM_ASM_000868 /TAXON_ID=225041 /ORGANISM="Chlamydomonas chlamydogama, Strain SAG 11-48b" /LENGTH=514 /DNA_ID=CAMNT_0049595683 /DNA_START=125 /DNA_END=1669 /DNA_ORIENTATION=-